MPSVPPDPENEPSVEPEHGEAAGVRGDVLPDVLASVPNWCVHSTCPWRS